MACLMCTTQCLVYVGCTGDLGPGRPARSEPSVTAGMYTYSSCHGNSYCGAVLLFSLRTHDQNTSPCSQPPLQLFGQVMYDEFDQKAVEEPQNKAGTRLARVGMRLEAGTRLALVDMIHYPVTLLSSHGTGEDPCR